MQSKLSFVVCAGIMCVLLVQVTEIAGHGRLLQPVARTSAWRKWASLFPAYYNDNQMFCGGVATQWQKNGGKCGICGEDYSAPKQFERGGSMYRNLIVAKYSEGQQIEATVEVTANHYGYFVFSVCKVDGSQSDATQACLDKNQLTDSNGKTKIYIERGKTGMLKFKLNLPAGFSCNHCVFQWKYNAGNSWGTDPVTGVSGIGEGPQEQFYGCSDIEITGRKRDVKEESMMMNSSTFMSYEAKLDELIKYYMGKLNHLYEAKEHLAEISN